MDNDYFIKLTLSVYRVSDLFPRKEPLKYQIRETANEILAVLVCNKKEDIDNNTITSQINRLDVFFKIAGNQNWTKKENLLILSKEYQRILEHLKTHSETKTTEYLPQKEEKPLRPKEKKIILPKISPQKRQEKIINLLSYKKRINLSEIRKVFSGVGSRTLRRDMELLAKDGLVFRKRNGQKDVSYWLAEHRTEPPMNTDNNNYNHRTSAID